jgi:hypothetical protein
LSRGGGSLNVLSVGIADVVCERPLCLPPGIGGGAKDVDEEVALEDVVEVTLFDDDEEVALDEEEG